MKQSELKKFFNYFVISTFTINIFYSIPVISSSQNNSTNKENINNLKPKLNIKSEKIATTSDGINVNIEKRETYFKFVCDPDLFFFPAV